MAMRDIIACKVLNGVFKAKGAQIFRVFALRSWFFTGFGVISDLSEGVPSWEDVEFEKLYGRFMDPEPGRGRRHRHWLFDKAAEDFFQHVDEYGCSYPPCPGNNNLRSLPRDRHAWQDGDSTFMMKHLYGLKYCGGQVDHTSRFLCVTNRMPQMPTRALLLSCLSEG